MGLIACRRPVWRCADQVQINSASAKALAALFAFPDPVLIDDLPLPLFFTSCTSRRTGDPSPNRRSGRCHCRISVILLLRHHGPSRPRHLLASAIATNMHGLRADIRASYDLSRMSPRREAHCMTDMAPLISSRRRNAKKLHSSPSATSHLHRKISAIRAIKSKEVSAYRLASRTNPYLESCQHQI